jgi:ACS family tartrate transporter-like MFS transporter
MTAAPRDVGQRARRRIALRLLPFVFVLYVVAYVDRANVSFANLRMSADLGFSDRVYGLGVGIFFLGYVLFEVPGAIIVERWSARKWLARIMITWGLVTVATGFVHTAQQFYIARVLLGVAEGSFFPGIIVYLTHWFRLSDRAKAIALFYCAVPSASVVGSVVASSLLAVHWRGLAGWRWIFILEGIPAIILGVVTILYLTDWPRQARWLSEEERNWISGELEAETAAKKKIRDYTIWQAFRNPQVILLILSYLFALTAILGTTYFIPTFIKRLSGLPSSRVALLVALPGLAGIAGMLLNGWHSDKARERRWHTAIPLACGGIAYLLLPSTGQNFPLAMVLLIIGGGLVFSYYPTFWSMPTTILSASAAAACFGLINSIGQIGGLVGPFMVGYLNDRTGSLSAAFIFIGVCALIAGAVVSLVKIRGPIVSTASALPSKQAVADPS